MLSRGERGTDRIELLGQARAAHPEVEACQRIEVRPQGFGFAGDLRRELVEDALLLGLGGQLGLAPGVGHLDRDEWLHEDRLTAA